MATTITRKGRILGIFCSNSTRNSGKALGDSFEYKTQREKNEKKKNGIEISIFNYLFEKKNEKEDFCSLSYLRKLLSCHQSTKKKDFFFNFSLNALAMEFLHFYLIINYYI